MSTLKVDTITDAAGTGKPNFSNGVQSGGTDVEIQRNATAAAGLTITNLTGASNPINSFNYIRVGGSMILTGVLEFTGTGTGTSTLYFTLPAGLNFNVASTDYPGGFTNYIASDDSGGPVIVQSDSTTTRFSLRVVGFNNPVQSQDVGNTSGLHGGFWVYAIFPIAEWQ